MRSRADRIGYTEALGRPALRAAIAEHYRRSYDLALDPERVVVTVGASGAFVLSFLAAFDPGDRVIVPEPAFPAYKNILRALGIEVVRHRPRRRAATSSLPSRCCRRCRRRSMA